MRRALPLALALALAAPPADAQISILGLRNSLIQFALSQISSPGELEITAEGVEDAEDGATQLVGVRVADGAGVWLEMDSVGLRWNARRILLGQLEINSLRASGVRVLRRPQPAGVELQEAQSAEPSEPFAWPRAPLTTRVDEIRLDGVSIAGGVIGGQSLAFDATGSLRDEGDVQSATLNLTRTDAVEGAIALDYLRDFAADTLKLNLTADEAAGGLLAELAGFPEDSASRARIDAEGPLTDWRLTFDAAAEQVFDADGSATIVVGPPLSVDAVASVRPGPALPPEAQAALAPEARLVARAAEDAEGVIRISEGSIRSPELTLDADGFFTRATGALGLDVTLAAGGGLSALVDGLAFERVGFDGRVEGALSDLTATGALALDGLRTAPADVATARLETVARVAGQDVTVTLEGDASGVRLDRLTPETLGAAELSAGAAWNGSVATLDHLRFVSPLLTLGAEGAVDVSGQSASLDYALSAPVLDPIARAYEVDAGGALAVDGRLDGALSAPTLIGKVALTALRFKGEDYGDATLAHEATLGAAPEGRLSLSADGSRFGPVEASTNFRFADQVLTVGGFEARALGAVASGDVAYRIEEALAEGSVDLTLQDFGPISRLAGQEFSGAAELGVVLTPENGAQTVAVSGQVGGLQGGDLRADSLTLDITARDALGDAPRAEGMIVAEGLAGPDGAALAKLRLEGTGSNLLADPTASVRLAAEGAAAAGNRIGSLTATLDARDAISAPAGTLEASFERIAAGGAEVPSATLNAALAQGADGRAPRLEARAAAPRVTTGGATISGAALTAAIDDPMGDDPVYDVRLTADAAAAPGVRLTSIAAGATGPLSALTLSVDAAGAVESGDAIGLSLRATADAVAEAPVVTVARLDARLGEARAALLRPMTVTAGESTTLDPIDLSLPGGRLSGAAALHPSGASGDLRLALSNLVPLAELAKAPIDAGALDVSARFDTRPGSASARISAQGDGLRPSGVAADIGAFALNADARWNGARLALDATVDGPFERPLAISAATPMRPSGGPAPSFAPGLPVDARVTWSGRIGQLWAMVPAPDHVLDGLATIDLAATGPIAAPRISGTLALADGSYQNLEYGTILTDLTVDGSAAPDGGYALTARATDGSGAPLTVDATIAGGALDARLRTTGAILARRDDVTASISADIAARGPLAGPAISGAVTVDRAEVRLVNSTPPSVADLGPVRIKGEPIPEPVEPAGSAVALDLTIKAPRNVFVRGRGLDSEWRIDMAVRGNAAAPVVTGEIERIRGQLSLVGAVLQMERGRIAFSGAAPVDPELDIALLREANGVKGGIVVRGYGSDPEIAFESTPSLPQGEVLPRVLFDKSQQGLSPAESLQLASGVATLLDGSGGTFDLIRSTVGLDVLRFDGGSGDEGPSVTVGQNIADGVYVGATQPVGGGSTKVVVEVELFDNVTADSEISAETGSSVGLNWRMDF
jgi:translocation and assembly module TamB